MKTKKSPKWCRIGIVITPKHAVVRNHEQKLRNQAEAWKNFFVNSPLDEDVVEVIMSARAEFADK